jgi:hypothetical protein
VPEPVSPRLDPGCGDAAVCALDDAPDALPFTSIGPMLVKRTQWSPRNSMTMESAALALGAAATDAAWLMTRVEGSVTSPSSVS